MRIFLGWLLFTALVLYLNRGVDIPTWAAELRPLGHPLIVSLLFSNPAILLIDKKKLVC
jgi:hypothetical protein